MGSDTLDNNKVAEAAKGTNVKVIITTFYQEGGSPEFDEGFKAWLNSDSEVSDQQRRQRHDLRCERYGLRRLLHRAGGAEGRWQHRFSKAVMAALPSCQADRRDRRDRL